MLILKEVLLWIIVEQQQVLLGVGTCARFAVVSSFLWTFPCPEFE